MLRILLFIGLLAGVNLRVKACSCVGTSTVASSLKQADFVAVGTVKARTRIAASAILKEAERASTLSAIDTSFFFNEYKYTVEIEEVFKGERHKKTVEIFTGAGGGDCGFKFSIGSRYVIYAGLQRLRSFNGRQIKVSPFLTTDICTRTTETNEAEVAALRKAASH